MSINKSNINWWHTAWHGTCASAVRCVHASALLRPAFTSSHGRPDHSATGQKTAHVHALRARHALEHEVLCASALGDAGQSGQLPAGAPPDLAEAALRKLLLQGVAADLVPAACCKRKSTSSPSVLSLASVTGNDLGDCAHTMSLPTRTQMNSACVYAFTAENTICVGLQATRLRRCLLWTASWHEAKPACPLQQVLQARTLTPHP